MEQPMTTLARLQVETSPPCFRPGPAPRQRIVSADEALRQIDHIEISHFVERHGVTYYILKVVAKNPNAKPPTRRASPVRMVGTTEEPGDAPVTCDYEVARRFSDFEKLRHSLSVCFQNLHPGCCAYCDAFVGFLGRSWSQPGLLTKLTTCRAAQRQRVLSGFINSTIALALHQGRPPQADSSRGPCDGRLFIPEIVACFLRD